jgi:hypothetical protein
VIPIIRIIRTRTHTRCAHRTQGSRKKEVLTVDALSREGRIYLITYLFIYLFYFSWSTQGSRKKEVLPVDVLSLKERELGTKKYPNAATQERANVNKYGRARVYMYI